MSSQSYEELSESLFQDNLPRLAVCLCLDYSYSMTGKPVDELTHGIRHFYKTILDDFYAKACAEIAIIVFFDDEAALIQDFTPVSEDLDFPKGIPYGGTPMAKGLDLALNTIDKRLDLYNNMGVDYYIPWLVVMSDGVPTDEDFVIENSCQAVADRVQQKSLVTIPIGVGEKADMDVLEKLSPNKAPYKLRGLDFERFFEYLKDSISSHSQSGGSTDFEFDEDFANSWSELSL